MTGSGLHSLALPYIICRRATSCEGFEAIGRAIFTQCGVLGLSPHLPQRVEIGGDRAPKAAANHDLPDCEHAPASALRAVKLGS